MSLSLVSAWNITDYFYWIRLHFSFIIQIYMYCKGAIIRGRQLLYFKYGQKSAWDFNDDLAAINLSMMYSPKANRNRKIKRRKYPKFRFAPSLGDIKENELFDSQLENVNKLKKDLASIHEERALNCGIPVVKDEGRHHRHKRHSRSFNERAWLIGQEDDLSCLVGYV